MNITEEFGNRIRYYRQLKNLSQEKLSEKCELHPSYIGQLERGEKTPSLETLFKLANGLEMSMSKMLEGMDANTTEEEDYYAYKAFQLLAQQSAKNQKHLFLVFRRDFKNRKIEAPYQPEPAEMLAIHNSSQKRLSQHHVAYPKKQPHIPFS